MKIDDKYLVSYLMYPKVFKDYIDHFKEFMILQFFQQNYFLRSNDKEYTIEIDKGKSLTSLFS